MSEQAPIVRRVDHIIIRVDDPYYDQLYALLSEKFQLPTPWPVNEQPGFKSGGIFAGNVDFEILRAPRSEPPSERATLYGVVFEAHNDFDAIEPAFTQLAARSIPYVPTPYVMEDETGNSETWWMNIFLGRLLGSNPWMELFFGYKRLIPDSLWLRLATVGPSNNQAGATFVFNSVYPNGIVFLVKYNPSWRDIDAERRESGARLQEQDGGPLGLRRVKAIEIGLRNYESLRSRWATLLRPHTVTAGFLWQIGDGPAIQVVPDEVNRIRSLIWEVHSLPAAEAFLRRHNMVKVATEKQIALEPAEMFGLNIRLVE